MQKYNIRVILLTDEPNDFFTVTYDLNKCATSEDLKKEVVRSKSTLWGVTSYIIERVEGFAIGSVRVNAPFDTVMEKLADYKQADSAGNHEAYVAFEEAIGGSYGAFIDAYQGAYESEQDYARELVESKGYMEGVPDSLKDYFDFKAFARNKGVCDYVFHHGHVFRLYDCKPVRL